MKQKSDYFMISMKIIMWILGALVIGMLLLKLTNHSPTLDQVMITLLGAILVSIITFSYAIGMHIGEVKRYIKESDRKFSEFAKDYREHIKTMHQ
jgi:NhaP-type Na+/H+ or K+/H+ antiporter